MKIVYVNDNDLIGSRFNGHDLQIMLNKNGYEAKQFVMRREGGNDNTLTMVSTEGGRFIREKCNEFEGKVSLQSVIYPFGELLAEKREFQEANVVHYHLIFNYFMSLYSFEKLSKMKPTVWTFHDPWAMTGHCIHPVECDGWKAGCNPCPYLNRHVALNEDNASSIWNIKMDIYKRLDIDIVVASQWMYDMVKKSPLTKHFKRVHLIPFGIDLDLFKRRKNREEIRKKLKIKKDSFVIMFRQDGQEWKGLKYIKEMLSNLKSKKPVTILAVGGTGLLEEEKKKYQVIEYEWVNNNDLMVDLYSAADLFLMPSVAEAFGLMAIESMACNLPVIVFEGTSLPSVTFSPKCGIALKKGDTETFVKTVERLISDPKECKERGVLGRKLVEEHYQIERYHNQLIGLYEEICKRNKKL
jgi:glycosyltransferase involved in cell wall biosynthesis